MDVVACGQRVGVSENESGGDMLEWGGGRIYAGAGSIREMDEGLGLLVVGDAAHLLRISTARRRSGRLQPSYGVPAGHAGAWKGRRAWGFPAARWNGEAIGSPPSWCFVGFSETSCVVSLSL